VSTNLHGDASAVCIPHTVRNNASDVHVDTHVHLSHGLYDSAMSVMSIRHSPVDDTVSDALLSRGVPRECGGLLRGWLRYKNVDTQPTSLPIVYPSHRRRRSVIHPVDDSVETVLQNTVAIVELCGQEISKRVAIFETAPSTDTFLTVAINCIHNA
jgi:hypothetical protein